MPNSIKIRVLVEYDPYLRLLAAFNRGQFHHSNRRDFLRSVLCAFVAIMFLIIIPLYIILIAWFVIENGVEWKKCAVAIPLVAAVLQMSITFIVMIIRNHAVSDVIDGLQQVIDQRESFYLPIFCYFVKSVAIAEQMDTFYLQFD